MTARLIALMLFVACLVHADTPAVPLKVGDQVPDVTLQTEDAADVNLRELVAAKPTVLIFYRGGWCPYCMRHLQTLQTIEGDIEKLGAQILAISVDQPAVLKATPNREKLAYRLLSDSNASVITAFGIAYIVDDATLGKLKEHKIDLDAAAGQGHHKLPYPAVYVANTKGAITFAHVNPDYKVRLEAAKILEALNTATDATAPAKE